MRISLACNWSYDLLDMIEDHPEIRKNVSDFYGTWDFSFTGSGRPFFIVPKLTREKVEDYINRLHEMGFKFSWLWSGECLGYYKFNEEEQNKALKELDMLDDLNVEYLTVCDPYIAEFAKNYSPNLKLKVSVINDPNSVSRALDWEEIIGPEGVITISNVSSNRNFPLLKEMRDTVSCDIELLLNDCCLYECAFRFFHYTECSHSSQTHDVLEGYYSDFCCIACSMQKSQKNEQLLMSRWILPTDIDKYVQIGIDYFKISGRRYSSNWLFNTLKAYSTKSYEGNLGDIFNAYSFTSDPTNLAEPQFSELAAKQKKMGGNPEDIGVWILVPDYDAKLMCENLGDFLSKFPFEGAKCAENCGVSCTYCNNYVEKAFIEAPEDSGEKYIKSISYLYDFISYGEAFLPLEERTILNPVDTVTSDTFSGVPWEQGAKDLFNDVMVIVPEQFKNAARLGVGVAAERATKNQGLKAVDIDCVSGVLIQVVPATFKHDVYDFLIEKEVDVSKYLTTNQIKEIKERPYGTEIMAEKAIERGEEVVTPAQTVSKAIKINNKKEVKIKMDTKEEWEAYLTSFMKAYNELDEIPSVLEPVAPLIFQYVITDRPEMNWWQLIEKDKMNWGIGEYSGEDAPKIIHKTDFETMKQVNSGESDPIQATMAGTYIVEGDMTKLMACAPLVPLNAKAHANAMK